MVSVHGACFPPYNFRFDLARQVDIAKPTNFFNGYIQNWNPAISTMKGFSHENQPFELQQKKCKKAFFLVTKNSLLSCNRKYSRSN